MNFQKQVYRLVKRIPSGRVSTYSAIAKKLGNRFSSRAVGQALAANPQTFIKPPHPERIPCHRVIRRDGSLGGYNGGLAAKRRLLQQEGVKIVSGKIDLKKYLAR